jgi:hypothetical protein
MPGGADEPGPDLQSLDVDSATLEWPVIRMTAGIRTSAADRIFGFSIDPPDSLMIHAP